MREILDVECAAPPRRDRSGEARHHQSARRSQPNSLRSPIIRRTKRSARAPCRSRARCGSSARTSWKCRRKDFIASIPGGEVRLRGVGIVKCEHVEKDANGTVSAVHCTLDPETRHGMPGADRKVKGTIHWVSAKHAVEAEVRLYDRLFTVPNPDDDSGRQDLSRPHESGLEKSRARVSGAIAERCRTGIELAVRAARIFRRGSIATIRRSIRFSTAPSRCAIRTRSVDVFDATATDAAGMDHRCGGCGAHLRR